MSQPLVNSSNRGSSSNRQLRQPGQHELPASTPCATLNTPATGLWRGWIIVARIGATSLNGQTPLRQYRHPLPMSTERELRPRRARRAETDRCYQASHRPQLPMSTERELRPRRAPVKYHESDDDDDDDDDDNPEWTALRGAQRARRAETSRGYRATHRARRLELQKRYRARHRERLLEANKRYREQHRDRIREKNRRYFKANQERLLARQQRYREAHREEVREKQQRYREAHREELREKQRQRDARRRELVREQNRNRRARFREKKRMEKLMTLTIPLTDCRKSIPVTEYVKAFCDSLDAVDTNVPPAESFLQLLEEDGPTRLDSGTMQVSEPSDCNDLSFLQDLLSPDEWEQVMDDVQDFDVEAFVDDDWLEDMTSSDEGVDLLYDLVS